MDVEKILTSDSLYKECLHQGQPDVPKRTAAETKAFFDSMAEKVLVPKINELVEASNKKANASDVYTTDEAHEQFDHRYPRFVEIDKAATWGSNIIGLCFFEGSEETVELSIYISFNSEDVSGNTGNSGSLTVSATVSKEKVTIVSSDYDDYVRECAIGEIISLRKIVGVSDDRCEFYIDWYEWKTSTNHTGVYAITPGQFELSDIHEYAYPRERVYNKDETYSKEEVYNKNEVYSKEEVKELHKTVTAPLVKGMTIDGSFMFVSSTEELLSSGEFKQYVNYELFRAENSAGEIVTANLRLGTKFSVIGGSYQFTFPGDTTLKPVPIDSFNGYKIISVTELGERLLRYVYPEIDEFLTHYSSALSSKFGYATIEDEQTICYKELALIVFYLDSEGNAVLETEDGDMLTITVNRPNESYEVTVESRNLGLLKHVVFDNASEITLNISKLCRKRGCEKIIISSVSNNIGNVEFITPGILPVEHLPENIV